MRRFEPTECVLVVVDVQEKLAAAMPADQRAEVERSAAILLESASLLGVHVIATEQYPRGLGPTVAPIAARLDALEVKPIEKMTFSAGEVSAFERALAASSARAVVVIGMEAHVCVFLTVRELAARGLQVLVPIDGVASRRPDHRAAGLELCRSAGATLTTSETLAFDWLRTAGTEPFKALSKLIR
jgi:nicotinamidase-related amidase